ncbi:MAG: cobalamin B12-binding domain-containing protein, partial [Thermicanus sp.]|nr:cobalamin B12-binding domain-containing protein [Thermicanus sp.]
INGPLMKGMDEVGKLFNENKLIVAEVLQSAEVMKAAVSYLQDFMEKGEEVGKGKVILATVKGDVHDIGKNLVDIILSNNGYEVINLGIKIPSEKLIEAYHEHRPDYIGLSGLLVKSAQQMSYTVQDLKKAGISIPVLTGGAALTKRFTETKIAPYYEGPVFYAKDAMEGLSLLNRLHDPHEREKLINAVKKHEEEKRIRSYGDEGNEVGGEERKDREKRAGILHDHSLREAPYLYPVTFLDYPLEEVIPYLNWNMLLGKHLGLRQGSPEEKRREIRGKVEALLADKSIRSRLRLKGKYQFFPAYSSQNTIHLLDERKEKEVAQFTFPRQQKGSYLSIADFIRPYPDGDSRFDSMALFVVTCGEGIREWSEALKKEGEYFTSYTVQALALELAEAFAERLHHLIRRDWGIDEDLPMQEILAAKYEGCRYSFGYPACPNLEDQRILFKVLKPEEIGVKLTEGDMMEPEASVSAIVVSHPKARYFAV